MSEMWRPFLIASLCVLLVIIARLEVRRFAGMPCRITRTDAAIFVVGEAVLLTGFQLFVGWPL